MTDAPMAARFAESDFRVGRVLNRSVAVLLRNLLPFFLVTVIAYLPFIVMERAQVAAQQARDVTLILILSGVSFIVMLLLSMLSQAVILQAAFQDMRRQPVNVTESLKVGLRRFFPVIALALLMGLLLVLGFMLLVVPGFIFYTMWFVALPICVVERLGPVKSLGRSQQLTKGHRWKIFGLLLLLMIFSAIVTGTVEFVLYAAGGDIVALIGKLIVTALWAAFSSVVIAVTYHDLRVAKEGIDIEQIAAVFD
jgi:uncharacterized membrane protein